MDGSVNLVDIQTDKTHVIQIIQSKSPLVELYSERVLRHRYPRMKLYLSKAERKSFKGELSV